MLDDLRMDEPPDTVRDPQRFLDPPPWMDEEERVPETLPSGDGTGTYATEVVMMAGCETRPESIAVAAHHGVEATCEHVAPLAVYGGEGEYYEVGARFMMASSDPDTITLSYPLGPDANLAIPQGHMDVFDAEDGQEPASVVVACALNDCPDGPLPVECPLVACAGVAVASVVNLEGTWTIAGPTIDPDALLVPTQDGRKFRDEALGISRGSVRGTAMRFEIGDYLFQGELTDRDHVAGQVIELMGYSDIGAWSATRIGS